MSGERWSASGVSPFFTERARIRAPQILSYASVGGAALLVGPNGKVAMMSGRVVGLDVERAAHLAKHAASTHERSLDIDGTCVQVAPIVAGWTLCAISIGIEPRIVLERLKRARAVMALALVDSGSPGSSGGGSAPSGSPAELSLPFRKQTN